MPAKKVMKEEMKGHHCCSGNMQIWGWVILILGIWVLMQDLGWIKSAISGWAIALILIGIWHVQKATKCMK